MRKPVLAVFDFDGTLTKKDTFMPFIKYVVGNFKYYFGLLILSPVLIGYILRIVPNNIAKEKFMIHYFCGFEVEELKNKAQDYAERKLISQLRPDAIQKLNWHQSQGHLIILISASLEIYLKPLIEILNIQRVLGTRFEVLDGYLTGKIYGSNCYGKEKVNRLKDSFGSFNDYEIYCYGDSNGDVDLLSLADYPYYKTFGYR